MPEHIIPAEKRGGADLLEFAAPEISHVFGCTQNFQNSCKKWGASRKK